MVYAVVNVWLKRFKLLIHILIQEDDQLENNEKLLYYMDGYHGGIRGHMPLGCWRDILEMLRMCPEWKLSVDVEPISWEFLMSRDPAAYDEIREMLRDQSIGSRLEMVSGSYAQPYGWITDGESNIRHITMGIDLLKKHFPWMEVKTYAVQEPCWTSALPQILKSLRFERAVLKDPSTAWGGYSAGFDAEICLWKGPDGTLIPLVPRYACEELLNVWETESVNGERDFAEKCITKGIAHPTGMYYQDLGWTARPRMSDKPGYEGTYFPDYIQYSTWKEYFEEIAEKPLALWNVSQEVFQGALPWGERILVRMARQVRRGEAAILKSERLNALAAFICGMPAQYARTRIEEAWGLLLMTQHHDGWICAGSGNGERNWAWLTSAQIFAVESLTDPLDRKSLYEIGKAICPAVIKNRGNPGATDENAEIGAFRNSDGAVNGKINRSTVGAIEMLSVVNPLGRSESRTVKAAITSVHGVESFKVYNGDMQIPSQYIPNRKYPDGSKNAGILTFNADLPGFGVKAFRIEPSACGDIESGSTAWIENGNAYLESNIYRVKFDLMKGGSISSLFDKRRDTEVVTQGNGERAFNEYYGYFIKEAKFFSSTERPAEAAVMADGPIIASLSIKGRVNDADFDQIISVTQNDPKITVRVVFRFQEKTYIGEPHEIEPKNSRSDGYRSYHDGRYKLNAYFPTAFEQTHIYKDAAYDVCKSGLSDTHFKRWDEIKHNILIGWVDTSDGEQGLTIMADHTTSYTHGDGYPLGLTMAWGWDGGFWWGRRQLKGEHELTYAIVPHNGDWRSADIWHEYQKMLHQPMVQRVVGHDATPREYELISVNEPIEMSAAYLDAEDRMIVRLFNPGAFTLAKVHINDTIAGLVELTELDGALIGPSESTRSDGKTIVTVAMPEFGIRTLRITK